MTDGDRGVPGSGDPAGTPSEAGGGLPASPESGLGPTAGARVGRRRTGTGGPGRPSRRAAPWIVAAAVASLAAAGPLAARFRADTPIPPVPGASSTTSHAPAIPSGWRVESYAGVQLRVPPTFGWGGAPESLACGVTRAFVIPGSAAYEAVPEGIPFVGRPAMMTDACEGGDYYPTPEVTAVWLGSPLAVGAAVTAAGPPSDTIAVGGQHVTVFAMDATLRAQILGSARAVAVDDNGCPSIPPTLPSGTDSPAPSSLSVCVYRGDILLWSGRRGSAQASAYREVYGRTSATYTTMTACTEPIEPFERVAVGMRGAGDAVRWDVVNFACGEMWTAHTPAAGGALVNAPAPLTPALVGAWASEGIRAYVSGGPTLGEDLRPYFRGMLG